MVEHQPRLLGSRVGRLRFFPFLPKLHFKFHVPFLLSLLFLFLSLSFSLRPFVCAKKTHLRIYPENSKVHRLVVQGKHRSSSGEVEPTLMGEFTHVVLVFCFDFLSAIVFFVCALLLAHFVT